MNNTHSKKLNLTGRRFGKGLVIKQVERPEGIIRQGRFWLVLCECGSERLVDGSSLKLGRWKSCGCIHEQDLTGQTFGEGTVLQLLKTRVKNNRVWLVQCKCGKKYKSNTNGLVWGNKKSCGCLNNRNGKNHPFFKGHEDITGNYWSKLKKGAVNRNIEFNVSIKTAWKKFVKQNKKCALTGWPITLGYYGEQTASVDRIDSSKGYVENNIQWLHKDINRMKQNFPEHYFITACKAIAEKELLLD